MGYIPNELSADEAKNLYMQGELSDDEAKLLSGNSFNPHPEREIHSYTYNGYGSKGYWDEDDNWHYVKDDD